jgi:KDO2-lipid IV(A) lauroyltransferase
MLPRRIAYVICEKIAEAVFLVDRKHRRIGLTNLRLAFPAKDDTWRYGILRESYRELGRHAVEVSRLAVAETSEISRYVSYENGRGLENYAKAKEKGKGVIFLTAHFCAWELLPSAHAVLGHPLSFLVRPLDNPYLDDWVTALRTRFGNVVVSKFGSVREILRILKEREDIGILFDQNVQEKDGVFAPLFGRPACTTASAAAIALKTGAPVVAGFMLPTADKGKYLIRFYPPYEVETTGDKNNDLAVNTANFNRYLEEVVREYPQCWLWGHRRFRTQPDGRDPYRLNDETR